MTPSQEPDDAAPRRPPGTRDRDAHLPLEELAERPEHEETGADEPKAGESRADQSKAGESPAEADEIRAQEGTAEHKGAAGGEQGPRTFGPPVDPYADPLSGAGPFKEPEAGSDDKVVAGEVYHATEPPASEMQRMRQYRKEQDDEAPPKPPPQAVGKYPWEAKIPTHPADTVRQFSSLGGAKPRRRRSDWPVLTFALVVAAVVGALCCLGGFALFSSWHPFSGVSGGSGP